jgi:COMPASS component SWD3
MLISGGWDNIVFIWDVRNKNPVGHILGPNVCGEALDIHGDCILAGSYNNIQNLSILSIKDQCVSKEIKWYDSDIYIKASLIPPCVYSAQFSKPDAKYVVAGGVSRNEVRVFQNVGDFREFKGIGSIANFKSGVVSIDTVESSTSGINRFVVGTSNGTIK